MPYKDKEDKKKYDVQYKKENSEKIKKYRNQYLKDNKEKTKEHSKQYYEDNREKIIKYSEQWQKDHPEHKKEYDKQYYKDNQKKIAFRKRKAQIKSRYNLSYEDWLGMWEGQDGRCAVCEKYFTKPSDAYIDHNHKTGEIRGLLCNKCNFAIGLLNDDPELVMRLAEYLIGE